MFTLEEAFEEVGRQLTEQEIDSDSMLDGLDLRDILVAIQREVSTELEHITELSDNAEQNEQQLRQLMVNAATRCFFTGVLLGRDNAVDANDYGVVVAVEAEALEAIAIRALRDGNLTFTLASTTDTD